MSRFDADYWLDVADLVQRMASSCRPDQAFLVKFDGLRSSDRTYTVLVDRPSGEGVSSFREDSGDLRASMLAALNRDSAEDPHVRSSEARLDAARLLACLDASVSGGAFLGIRLRAGKEGGLFEVSMAGPALGREFFVREDSDLVSLLRQVTAFHQRNTHQLTTRRNMGDEPFG